MKIDASQHNQGSVDRTYIDRQQVEREADNKRHGDKAKSGIKDSTVFIGDTVIRSSIIDQRRQFGRESAIQVLRDTFKADKVIDDRVVSMREKIKDLESQTTKLTQNIKEVDAKQKEITEKFDVKPGSQEYEDLLLMNRQRIYKKYGFEDDRMKKWFTDDEWSRLQVLNERGPTEYQSQSMQNQEAREHYSNQLLEIRQAVENNRKGITSIQLVRLKTHPMADAKEAADKIIELSEKSIKGMLINEGIQQADEEKKENQEQVEEAQKKKEEEEGTNLEVLNKTDEAKKKQIPNDAQDAALDVDQVQQSIGKIVDKMQLMAEDLKGLIVDKNM